MSYAFDAQAFAAPDPSCLRCGHDSCSGDCERPETPPAARPAGRVDRALLVGSSVLVAEGRRLIAEGVRYVLPDIIPDYGMLGFFVAYAKTGKTSSALPMVRAISMAGEFLGRRAARKRTLYLALEDPREYLAWMAARSLQGDEDALFYCGSLSLDDLTMAEVEQLIRDERIGFVYVSTLMAGVRELVKDENDNAGLARVVEALKASARRVGVPYLFEAHAGKGEDQSADADPVRALRGASAAAAAADFVLSLKRDGAGMTTRRVLSGAGRFVNFAPISFDYDPQTGTITYIGAQKDAAVLTTVNLIRTTGAVIAGDWRSVSAVMNAAGATDKGKNRTLFRQALDSMPDIEKMTAPGKGGKVTRYRLASIVDEAV